MNVEPAFRREGITVNSTEVTSCELKDRNSITDRVKYVSPRVQRDTTELQQPEQKADSLPSITEGIEFVDSVRGFAAPIAKPEGLRRSTEFRQWS